MCLLDIMKGKEQCVIFLLTAFLGCNNIIIAQQPGNDFCANAQELCPNQFAFATTDQATIDNCPTCSDFGVFNLVEPQATIWYVFKTNSNGDSVAVTIDITSIPTGIEVGGALQLRVLKQQNPCDPATYEYVNSVISSTSTDTLFYFGSLLPNTFYSLVFNENTTGVADPGIEFLVKVSGEAVIRDVPSAVLTYSDTVCLNETAIYSLQLTNRCLIYDEIGFTRPGGAAELITVPAWLAHVVKDNVSDECAVLAEPTAVVTQAFMKASPKTNSKILIIGDGTIALIAATMAKTYQPKLIHMLGLKDGQNEIAKSAGVDQFLTQPTDEKYDLIIEAAGAPTRISAAIGQLVRGGTLLLLGYPGHQKTAAIVVDDVINGDLNIIGSFGSSLMAWEKTVAMFNSGELNLGYLVTHKFGLSDFAEAIEALKSAPAPRGKIALIIN